MCGVKGLEQFILFDKFLISFLMFLVFQFGVYDTLVRQAVSNPHLAENKATVEFFSGFAAGCMATLVSFPFDIVRTRLITQGNRKVTYA